MSNTYFPSSFDNPTESEVRVPGTLPLDDSLPETVIPATCYVCEEETVLLTLVPIPISVTFGNAYMCIGCICTIVKFIKELTLVASRGARNHTEF